MPFLLPNDDGTVTPSTRRTLRIARLLPSCYLPREADLVAKALFTGAGAGVEQGIEGVMSEGLRHARAGAATLFLPAGNL